MAPDKKGNKRKAPAVSDPPAKKTKKVEAKAAPAPKSILKKKENSAAKTKETKSEPVKANDQSTRQAKPRKRAADFISDEESDEPAPATISKKAASKKTKKDNSAPAEKKTKVSPKAKKAEVAVESEDDDSEEEVNGEDEGSDSEEEIDILDDQTAALIKGFESSGDEDESGDEGFNPDKPVPKIPDTKKAQKKLAKSQKQTGTPEEPGTVYVGRIPHGFYEHEMRAYFSQFGEITRLRLSRNRITGRSKHYAFVEFDSTTVAKIVAETMDNYLMYGHILKCKFVPQEQLHPEVWKGANRRFKRTPWNRIEKKRLEKGKTRDQWSKRIEREQKKRQAKIDKMQALGYSIDLPQLKSVEDVPIQEAPKAVEAAEATEAQAEEPVKAIEEAPAAKEDTPKKAKKGKKTEQDTPKEKPTTESPATKKKAKKTKTKA